MKIAIKEVGKELQIIETNKKYRGDCARQFTGQDDPVEFVRLNDSGTFSMGVNENGLPLQMPLNFYFEAANVFLPIQKAVGTVVFIRCKYVDVYKEEIWDYEIEDLSEEDVKYIREMLDETYQQQLKNNFRNTNGGFVYGLF